MFRILTQEEITVLESRGCRCDDWSNVQVAEGFDPARVTNVEFSGDIRIGSLAGRFVRPGGLVRRSEITNATQIGRAHV